MYVVHTLYHMVNLPFSDDAQDSLSCMHNECSVLIIKAEMF